MRPWSKLAPHVAIGRRRRLVRHAGRRPHRYLVATGKADLNLLRYLIARKLGLYAGLDVARGPEDTVVYLQIGSAWN